MGKEFPSKKRKASVPEGQTEKMVKRVEKITSDVAGTTAKKRKATEDAAPIAVKKSKTPKPIKEVEHKIKPTKKDVHADEAPVEANGGVIQVLKSSEHSKSASKVSKPVGATAEDTRKENIIRSNDEVENEEDVENEDEESDIDDQTEALLKGFESEGDEEDGLKDGGLSEGQKVPKVPTMNNQSRKMLKRAGKSDTPEKTGVVYIGRIPHGFYEHEMREYFQQFGTILKLRLSRNRKTGRSKHVAWIQFESATVAEIVAKTMDNYLLFNHILKVKVVPDEQVPENLFKGANKRFKKVPWNKIEGRKLEQGASEEVWEKRATKEQRRRDDKAEKLKEIGYEFTAPKIKSAKGVAKKRGDQLALKANGDGVTKAIEAAPTAEQSSKLKKQKKNAKTAEAPTEAVEEMPALATKEPTKSEKEKKSGVTSEGEPSAKATSAPEVEEPDQPKKKKEKKKNKAAETNQAPATSTHVVTAAVSDKKSKSKKSKTALIETTDGPLEEKVEKLKKNKKIKADA